MESLGGRSYGGKSGEWLMTYDGCRLCGIIDFMRFVMQQQLLLNNGRRIIYS